MALYHADVTFDVHQILGADFDARRTKAYVRTNVENKTLMDTSTGEIRMGDQAVTINSDGTGTFTTWVPGVDGNPVSWQTYIVFDYARTGQRDRQTRTFGPYTITGIRYVERKSLTSNVATITTTTPHGLVVGDVVTVAGVDATFDGTYTITAVPSTTRFSYAKTAADVTTVLATGEAFSTSVPLTWLEEEQAVPPAYLTTVTELLDGIVADASDDADRAEAAQAATEANINGLDIGTVTTGAAGSAAAVTLTGTAPGRHFNFTIPTGPQGLPGPGAAAWTASQAVVVGSVRQAPDGSWIKSTAARTTRGSFDTTEQGFWAPVSATAGTLEQAALSASIDDRTADAVAAGVTAADIPGQVNTAIADSPTVTAAVTSAASTAVPAAVTADLATRPGLPQSPTEYDTTPLVSIRDASNHRTWLEAKKSDGGPTTFATDAVRTALDAQRTTTDDPTVLVGVRDATGHRTWLEARTSDGGMTKWAIDRVREGLASTSYLNYVADGDSLTQAASGGGTNYPSKLSALLGKTVANTGASGALASEVALWAGGICPKIVVTGNQIPADTSAVAATVTLPDSGPTSNRTFDVKVQGVACTLAYSTTGGWTLARKVAAGAATPVPKPAVAIPDVSTKGNDYVHIVWVGRNNNTPRSAAQQPVLDTAAEYRRTGTRFLIVSITNRTDEPSGTTAYNDIIAVNDAWRAAYPREYVELRSRLINEGLALAGLTPTSQDTTDIANDCIPTSLLADGMHMNDNGRVAVAAILLNELQIRGLA